MFKLTRHSLLLCFSALTLALLFSSSCVPLDDGSPQISTITISPSTFSKSSTGMTDEFITVTIVTANFTEPLEDVTVTIQDLNREVIFNTAPEINGDTIIKRTPLAQFSDLDVGEHAISATAFSQDDLQTAGELNLTTITVTP